MIKPQKIFDLLKDNDIDFFTGVPDSLLKEFCSYITDNTDTKNHIIAANEGNSVALAAGYHLATNKIGLVYMQNSGMGNTINPILSLIDEDVYKIPVFFFIGWRGETGKKDEPQHVTQGKLSEKILDTIGMGYSVLSDNFEEAKVQIEEAIKKMKLTNKPYAMLIRKNTFEKYTLKNKKINDFDLTREETLDILLKNLIGDEIIVSTTGKTSRELFELREKYNQGHEKDFLTVGSMGHTSSIALGLSIGAPNKKIICIDGDGSMLMHMGAIAINANHASNNFKYIVINNGSHESVGGQPTICLDFNVSDVGKVTGFQKIYTVTKKEDLEKNIIEFLNCDTKAMLEIKVKKGSREDLGRPTIKPVDNKINFMNNILNK